VEVDSPRADDRPVTSTEPSRRPGAAEWVRGGLLLALPLALALGLWWWQSHRLSEAEEARADDRAVVAAARQHTSTWASVDHREVDDYVKAVRASATGAFLSQFEESEAPLRQLLEDNRSVQVPTVPEGGVALLERDDDQARVLVAMDAAVTNKSAKRPQPRQYRLQVELTRTEGEWLISGLEFIDGRS
jgi:Mce-associated membrane protein